MIGLSPASRYISDLLATPADSVDHWIAEDIWAVRGGPSAVRSYLSGLMSMHPECDRAYEIASELSALMMRRPA